MKEWKDLLKGTGGSSKQKDFLASDLTRVAMENAWWRKRENDRGKRRCFFTAKIQNGEWRVGRKAEFVRKEPQAWEQEDAAWEEQCTMKSKRQKRKCIKSVGKEDTPMMKKGVLWERRGSGEVTEEITCGRE